MPLLDCHRFEQPIQYVRPYLVAIIKKRLNLETSLYTILQVLSLTLFERLELKQMLTNVDYISENCSMAKQLNLFDNYPGH